MRCHFAFGLLVSGLLAFGVWGQALAQTTPPGTRPVSQPVRDLVEAEIGKDFVLPQTTQWRFDYTLPYAGGSGDVVCGSVNYQSAQRKYVGWHVFYAIVDRNTVKLNQVVDPSFDTTGQIAARFRLLCYGTP